MLWRTTYRIAGEVKQVKDYQLCRGEGADDLYVDEGGGLKLAAELLGGVLFSAFKYNDVLRFTSVRLRGKVLEHDNVSARDASAVTGALSLETRSLQRLSLRRVGPAPSK